MRNFKFQAEYLHRKEDGALTFDATGAGLPDAYRSTSPGGMRRACTSSCHAGAWACATRHSDCGPVDLGLVNDGMLAAADFPVLAENDPKRCDVDGRFLALGILAAAAAVRARRGALQPSDNQFFLQYIMSLGTHGAHKF